MPEGHVIHRLARRYGASFAGRPVVAESPQGRFADGAVLLDGQTPAGAEAHGKHLFVEFPAGWLHVHLGLYGKVAWGEPPVPAPVGQIRLRLANTTAYADLRGPTVCEVLTPGEKDVLHARLGPDPLRPAEDGQRARDAIARSRQPIATLLMDQKVISGVGNIYRAEVLFRHRLDPLLPGRDLTDEQWKAIWDDLVVLMADGVAGGRIDTVRPEHLPEAMGRPPREDAHGGEVYVYRRAGLPCLVCGTEVRTGTVQARNLFWCPTCQGRA
ncbi:Fpg/Nei family DNA glycosylase [Actinocorallia sp. API 0066]|uniref:Fpg/Nei family DNA glycosylase n=1 Tax=Actinocorallia sp. API 0066 TaxID=2896846 RepID=UPI001E4811ED|nr:DNA-formamidopyrimidine glycosylase family protein [Actinocorallia sp. API 0066]MCD0449539.1 Fpg/Nei family DNA glycosylase [Actinocorallia sp. API 0066]